MKADASGRVILILTLVCIALWVNKKQFYRIAFQKPLIIWGIWVVYAFTITLREGTSDDIPNYAFFLLIFIPYFLLIVLNLMLVKNFNRLVNVLIFGMYVNLIIILIFNKGTGVGDRFGGDINSNTIGLMATVLLMFIYLKFALKKNRKKFLIVLTIIPIFTIIISGSKTAFGGLVLLVLTHIIINRTKKTVVNIIKFVLSLALFTIPLYFILHNTNIGERILSSTEEGEELEIETGNAFLDKFGDRGVFYYIGWQVFKEHPITGVGLGNYVLYNDDELAQHSEYMIQLSELGIIGFVLFCSFYTSIFGKFKKIKINSDRRKLFEICLAYTIIILVMITATRMYRVWFLFSVIGVVTGFLLRESTIDRKKIQ